MLDIKNKTWFMIPVNIAIALILIKGFKETFSKSTSLAVILWFCLVVLFCVYINVGLYNKLKKITRQSFDLEDYNV